MGKVFRSKGLRDKEKQIQKRRSSDDEKKSRESNRLRSKTVAFRMTPEEKELLDNLVESSGLLKQDYIIQALIEHSVTYVGSPKMARELNEKIEDLLKQLKKLNSIGQVREEQLIYLEKIMELSQSMKKEKSL